MSGASSIQRRKIVTRMALVAGIAVLLGASTFIPPTQEKKRAEVGAKVLPQFAGNADKVALVMVTTAEESYHLVRNGTDWVMSEKGNFPVQAEQIAKLTRALSVIGYARPMTRDDKKFDRIGLGDPAAGGTGALLEVGDGAGTVFGKLIVGYREGRSYVREPGDLQAWAVEGGDMPPLQRGAAWLDLGVVHVPPEDIAEVQVRPRDTSWYTLLPVDETGQEFRLAQPHSKKRLVTAYGPTLVAQALSRFSPTDVQPADKIASGAPVAQYVLQTRRGVAIIVQCWRKGDLGWVTLNAAVSENAPGEALVEAQMINSRATGWAFAMPELDWTALSTPLSELAE